MPSQLENTTQQLHARIARSRRRLDRQVQQVMSRTTRWLPASLWCGVERSRTWTLMLLVGIVLTRWGFRSELWRRQCDQRFGQTVATWIDRLLRRTRVALWRYRRSTAAPAESES